VLAYAIELDLFSSSEAAVAAGVAIVCAGIHSGATLFQGPNARQTELVASSAACLGFTLALLSREVDPIGVLAALIAVSWLALLLWSWSSTHARSYRWSLLAFGLTGGACVAAASGAFVAGHGAERTVLVGGSLLVLGQFAELRHHHAGHVLVQRTIALSASHLGQLMLVAYLA
jgi:hypothetical protein